MAINMAPFIVALSTATALRRAQEPRQPAKVTKIEVTPALPAGRCPANARPMAKPS